MHDWVLLIIGTIIGHILTWAVMLAFGGDEMDPPSRNPLDQGGRAG